MKILLGLLLTCCSSLLLAQAPIRKDLHTVEISSWPTDAWLKVNGANYGKTPDSVLASLFIALKPGQYTIRAYKDEGHLVLAAEHSLTAVAGKHTRLKFDLAPTLAESWIEQFKDISPDLSPKFEMVTIPAGSFEMGGHDVTFKREFPKHTVTVPAFAMMKHELTFNDWDKCVLDQACIYYPQAEDLFGRGRRPVVNVSWADIQIYVQWLNRKTGLNYRLPSEAEWEYAARAGSKNPYHKGNCLNYAEENFAVQENPTNCPSGYGHGYARVVGSHSANAWGLYDMLGNVSEWVEDCWQETYDKAANHSRANSSGDCSRRGIRGSNHSGSMREARVSYRDWRGIALRQGSLGFRLVRSLP
jgi:formylglycine-generating enzyme required for sulfatase activity